MSSSGRLGTMPDASKEVVKSSNIALLTKSEYEALEKLFDELDIDKDGQIDAAELAVAFDCQLKNYLENKVHKVSLTLNDFLNYVISTQKNIMITFEKIDKNHDGKIDPNEMMEYLSVLGVDVSLDESQKICNKIAEAGHDKNADRHGLEISFENWHDFFRLGPSKSVRDLIQYWKYCTFLDIAEMNIVPEEVPYWSGDKNAIYVNLLSGMVAGITSRTSTAPLDRLKIVMQYLGLRKDISLLNGLKYLINEGGIKGLWRGNFLNCLKIAPETAFKFMFYDELKNAIRRMSGKQESVDLTIQERFVAGSIAGLLSQSIIYPFDVLKTRIILSRSGEVKGIFPLAREMLKKEGLRCFYKGFLPNVIGIIPYAGTDLAIYETLKRRYVSKIDKKQSIDSTPSALVLLTCGAVSTFTAQIISYPLALVRTRLQAQVSEKTSMTSMFSEIWRKQGLLGFYKGIIPNACKVMPAVSISYLIYETTKKSLESGKSLANA